MKQWLQHVQLGGLHGRGHLGGLGALLKGKPCSNSLLARALIYFDMASRKWSAMSQQLHCMDASLQLFIRFPLHSSGYSLYVCVKLWKHCIPTTSTDLTALKAARCKCDLISGPLATPLAKLQSVASPIAMDQHCPAKAYGYTVNTNVSLYVKTIS